MRFPREVNETVAIRDLLSRDKLFSFQGTTPRNTEDAMVSNIITHF